MIRWCLKFNILKIQNKLVGKSTNSMGSRNSRLRSIFYQSQTDWRDLFLLVSASRGRFETEKKSFEKSPHLFVFKRSQIEYLWMVLMAEHLRAQWDILLLFIDILTKYFIVLSNLSRQHHSAGTQFGFFKIQTNVGFLSKYLFFCQKTSSWSTGFWYTISWVRPSLGQTSSTLRHPEGRTSSTLA